MSTDIRINRMNVWGIVVDYSIELSMRDSSFFITLCYSSIRWLHVSSRLACAWSCNVTYCKIKECIVSFRVRECERVAYFHIYKMINSHIFQLFSWLNRASISIFSYVIHQTNEQQPFYSNNMLFVLNGNSRFDYKLHILFLANFSKVPLTISHASLGKNKRDSHSFAGFFSSFALSPSLSVSVSLSYCFSFLLYRNFPRIFINGEMNKRLKAFSTCN